MKMTRKSDKQYQFAKLCMSLTKQGFRFTRQKGVACCLVFDKVYSKRLFNPFTKLPFVNSVIRVAGDNKKDAYQFEQWAGRN